MNTLIFSILFNLFLPFCCPELFAFSPQEIIDSTGLGDRYSVGKPDRLNCDVFFGRDLRTGKRVTIKFWNLAHAPNRIKAENQIRILEELNSGGHIESGWGPNYAYLVYEYQRGRNLLLYNRKLKKLSGEDRIEVMLKIAKAILAELINHWHRRGIVHGDMAARQILIQGNAREGYRARLIDQESAFFALDTHDWLGPYSIAATHFAINQLPPELESQFVVDQVHLNRLGHFPRDFWNLGISLSHLLETEDTLDALSKNTILLDLMQSLTSRDPEARYTSTWKWILANTDISPLPEFLSESGLVRFQFLRSDKEMLWDGAPFKAITNAAVETEDGRAYRIVSNAVGSYQGHSETLAFLTERPGMDRAFLIRFYPYTTSANAGCLLDDVRDEIEYASFLSLSAYLHKLRDRRYVRFAGVQPLTCLGNRCGFAVVYEISTRTTTLNFARPEHWEDSTWEQIYPSLRAHEILAKTLGQGDPNFDAEGFFNRLLSASCAARLTLQQ